jgi:diguanylate cyclase (GGDEF)-like protein
MVTDAGTAQDPLSLFARAADALAGTTDVDDGVEQLMGLAADRLGAEVAIAYLQDPDRTELTLGIALGLDQEERAVLEQGLGQVDDPVALTSLDRAARDFTGTGPSGGLAAAGLAAAALRPLVVARGGIELPVGVLVVGWRSPRTLTDDEQVLLGAVADLTAVAIDRARLASMILERSEWFERLAHTDPLTGLANQRTFARILELELARAGRQGSEISLAVFDVDGLGAINERLGHATGDDVLRSVASVLAESVRLVDTVARQGGDEFVLVAPGAAGPTVAQRVLTGVAALPPVGDQPVSLSAGVARFPADGASADELIAAAQGALAKARAEGPGRIGATEVESRG